MQKLVDTNQFIPNNMRNNVVANKKWFTVSTVIKSLMSLTRKQVIPKCCLEILISSCPFRNYNHSVRKIYHIPSSVSALIQVFWTRWDTNGKLGLYRFQNDTFVKGVYCPKFKIINYPLPLIKNFLNFYCMFSWPLSVFGSETYHMYLIP